MMFQQTTLDGLHQLRVMTFYDQALAAIRKTCGRPTKGGRPCRRPLQWYETACPYHATQAELDQALQRLRNIEP